MERSSIGKALGCLAIFPAASFGMAALADGIGPTGWRGFAELFGWVAVCVAASYCVGLLFTHRGWPKAGRYLAGIAVAGALTMVVRWLGLGAPMADKVTFTSALQMLGLIAVIGCLVLLVHCARDSRRVS